MNTKNPTQTIVIDCHGHPMVKLPKEPITLTEIQMGDIFTYSGTYEVSPGVERRGSFRGAIRSEEQLSMARNGSLGVTKINTDRKITRVGRHTDV